LNSDYGFGETMELTQIGTPPWDRDYLLGMLREFADLYRHRPIRDNSGGMKSAQMFPAWLAIQHLQPEIIIESGVWRGQGTWFFEQAAPSSKLVCIDPFLRRIEYRSKNGIYSPYDFSMIDWSTFPKNNSLCFFDDHQNALSRVVLAKKLGFNILMFADNYPVGQGECLSLKKVLAGDAGEEARNFLHDTLKGYYEFPPVIKGHNTRWGDPWTADRYPTPDPLLDEIQDDALKCYLEEYDNYTWICYAELK